MKKKRIIALLLAIVLCIGMLPLSAFAEEPEAPTESVASQQQEDGDPITVPSEEPEDACQPEEEITAAPKDTPDNVEPSVGLEPIPTPDPEDNEDHERTPAGPSEEDPIMAYDGMAVARESKAAPVLKKGLLKAAARVGDTGTMRVLYYVFKEDVGNTASFGHIERLPAKAVLTDGIYKAAYCLDSELLASNGTSYTWDTMEWANKRLVGDVLALGFQYVGSSGWTAESAENYKWAVCQLITWAIQNGKITRNTDGIPYFSAQVDADMQTAANHSYNPSGMMAYYNSLKADLIKLRKIPSFAGRTASTAPAIKLSWNGSSYGATVTDSNGVLSRFSFSIPGITLSPNGNTLTLSANGDSAGEKISSEATYAPHIGEGAVAVWKTQDASYQKFAVYDSGGEVDPIPAYIKVSFDAVGSAGLEKASEDGIVSGISFTITGSDGSSATKTTDSSGSISLDSLPIYQSGEDGEDGERITYTATEQTPIRYVTPRSQTFQLFEGQETSLSFENRLKKWSVSVTKSDRETTSAQGDATLSGAVYGIYHNGVLQDSYTTNASGKFTSTWYPCGTEWTLKEISPSTGYLLNETTVSIGLEPGSTSIEYNATSKSVVEQVKKGRVSIVKHTDTGETQIETPETGAEFQIYLTAAGSYANAKATERDTLTCNEAGFAQSKLLPYGRYTVHQTKGWDGREKITDFQVFIAEDGKTYPFIINNRIFEAYIQVVKLDATTGRVIPASGVGFKIRDLTSGKFITQHINYPTPQDIVVYYTDVTGKLMLPDTLGYGTYQLIETNSAYGYTLASEPVTFMVDGTSKTVTVTMQNTPQMGQISLEKTGEVFASVTRGGETYQPVYEVTGLAGAVYALYAEEDITTLDGTQRYAAGQLVEQVETNAQGKATFPAVNLGRYKVVEDTAPSGYVKDPTEYHVHLDYAGQTVALVTEHLACTDARQKVQIDLLKTWEQDETYHLGMNSEREAIRFGLYAAEKLTARDGQEIPEDGLLEKIRVDEHGKATFASDLPFGRYYVKETSTEEHYNLNSTRYPVEFLYAGQSKATVRLHANDGQAIENTLIRGRIAGRKTDDDGKALARALYGIFRAGTDTLTEQTAIQTTMSNTEGEFSFENVPYGFYVVKELRAPTGFVLNPATHAVNIRSHGQVVEIEAENKAQLGVIRVYKQGEVFASVTQEDERYIPVYEARGLPGAVYEITAAEDIVTNGTVKHRAGEVVDTITTGEDGWASSRRLNLGRYTVTEKTAPHGMVLNTEPMTAELVYAGQLVEVTDTSVSMTNLRQKARINLHKSVELDDLFEIGRNGEAESVSFSLFAAEELTAEDGTSIPQDGLVDIIVLSDLTEDGGKLHASAAFTADLPLGTYYVRETSLDEHYLPAPDYTVTFIYEDQMVEMVALSVNDRQEIDNKIKRGSITGHKVGEDGDALAGILFGLFPADTEEFTAEDAFLSVRSGEDGAFTFDRVPYGSYQVKELETLPGYVLQADPIPVEITEDGQVVDLGDLVNEHTKVRISKQSITGDAELPGATLKVFTADGELVEEWVSTDQPHLMERLPVGAYVLHEVTAPSGYLVAEDVAFTVEETGEIQPVVMKDRPRPPVIVPRYGALKIVKTSEDGVLEGFAFRITGPGFDKTFTTDAYGEISAENLTPGEYTVTEVGNESTARYVLPERQTLMVEVDRTAKAEFYNRLARGSLQGRKNGEDGKGLAGVTFGLFPADAEAFTQEGAIATSTTGEDGSFAMSSILLGQYQLVELETLPGYVLLADPIPVEITEEGQEINLGSVVNEHTKVQISKQDFTTGKELPGAKLEIRDQDGKVVESWTSTDKPHLIERLPVGKYTLREVTAPAGYDVAEEVTFEVKPTGEIQQVIMKDKPTPEIPNTGDERKMVAAGLVLAASLAGAVCLFLLRRRRKK